MNREIIHKRISSISGDIQRMSSALPALDSIDISNHFKDYERLSLEAAQRAECIARRMRHLVYILVQKSDYLPKAVDALGIEVQESEGIYEIMLPGLMPKRRARQGTE